MTLIDETQQDKILAVAAQRYGVSSDQCTLLSGGHTNFVYDYQRAGEALILRWTPYNHRSTDEIKAEVDWINYLADHGAAVASIVPSQNGQQVEVIEIDGLIVSVVSFTRVPGESASDTNYPQELGWKAGQCLGTIHTLTKNYRPAPGIVKRRQWHEYFAHIAPGIPSSQPLIREKWRDLERYLHHLPQDDDTYGLVHGDYQEINFFAASEEITVFDFDDCHYNWFIYDIARALYFALWIPHPGQSNQALADQFLNQFLEGYKSEYRITPYWIQQIPVFLKWIEMDVYVSTSRIFAANQDSLDNVPPRIQQALKHYRHNIENDIPYIDSAYFPWGG